MGRDDVVCPACRRLVELAQEDWRLFECSLWLGKPFEQAFHCEHCGVEICTAHFHGVGDDGFERAVDFVCPPGRKLGPTYMVANRWDN